MKTAINPTTIGIQFWPSKPRRVKCSVKTCTLPPPFLCRISSLFVQDKSFCGSNILFLYSFGRAAWLLYEALSACACLLGGGATVPEKWPAGSRAMAQRRLRLATILAPSMIQLLAGVKGGAER